MATINQLANNVQTRLEEVAGSPGTFWSLQNELYPLVIEAMNEAALISGFVQTVNNLLTIPANTNYVTMPKGWISILTIRGPQAVRKTEIFALDKLMPGWEGQGGSTATPAITNISAWFPIGLTSFGVYPMLSIPQQVTVAALAYPVTQETPYDGTQAVPYPTEYFDALEGYTAAVARYKESGLEMEEATQSYQEFLSGIQALSAWMNRSDTLVFSRSVGAPVRINPVEVR